MFLDFHGSEIILLLINWFPWANIVYPSEKCMQIWMDAHSIWYFGSE